MPWCFRCNRSIENLIRYKHCCHLIEWFLLPFSLVYLKFSLSSTDLTVLSVWTFSMPLDVSRDCSRYVLSIAIHMCIISFVYCDPDVFCLLRYFIAFQICFFYCDLFLRSIYVSSIAILIHICFVCRNLLSRYILIWRIHGILNLFAIVPIASNSFQVDCS